MFLTFLSGLPTSPSAAYTVAAALNLTPAYKGSMVSTAVPEQSEALNLGKKRTSNNNNSGEDDDEGSEGGRVGENTMNDNGTDGLSAAKRIKTERSSPPTCCSSEDETTAVATVASNGSPEVTDFGRFRSDSGRSPSPPTDEDMVEMDINTLPSTGE